MEDNNYNLNLELTLATGPTQNPNPVNPQIWATTGGHHQQPPVTNGVPTNRPRGRNGRFISRPKTRQLSVVINPVEENGQENMEIQHKKGKGMVLTLDPTCDAGPSSKEHIPQEIFEKIEKDVATRYHESNSQLQKEVMDLRVQVHAQKETIKNLEMTLELLTKQAPVVDQPTPLE